MKKKRRCTVCGKHTFTQKNQVIGEDGKKYSYDYFPCCDYYKQNTFPTKKDLERIYGEDYAGFGEKGFFGKIKNIFTYYKAFLFRSYIKGKKILEIGSGTGQFLNSCKYFKPTSKDGLEFSKYAVEYAKENYNINIYNTTFENFKTRDRFNSIFLFHVIEHFSDPLRNLRKIWEMLSNERNSYVIIETPNANSFAAKYFKKYWCDWRAPSHMYMFTRTSLIKLLASCGFRVEKVNYSFVPNAIYGSIQRKDSFFKKNKICSIILLPFITILSTLFSFLHTSSRMTIIARKISHE